MANSPARQARLHAKRKDRAKQRAKKAAIRRALTRKALGLEFVHGHDTAMLRHLRENGLS